MREKKQLKKQKFAKKNKYFYTSIIFDIDIF